MQILSEPLRMTEAENRAALEESERRRLREGDPHGNRHERRLAAKRERVARKRAAKKEPVK